jgi:hypothetical protein
MAEDLRTVDTQTRDPRGVAIAEEAMRQSESALYTSTALYIWLREARRWNHLFVIAPVLLGALSGLLFFKDPANVIWASLLAILTGFVPALRDALRLDIHLDQIRSLATEYKGLQDSFRQLANISAPFSLAEAERQLAFLMDQLNHARAHGVTIPERVFKEAQEKVDSGDYDFSVDQRKKG